MLKIAVLGGGNGAYITAADLALQGFDVNICEFPQFGESLALAKEQGGIHLEIKGNPGLEGGFAKLNKVTTDIKEAISDRDVIFLVVPAFAQSIFAEFAAQELSPEQIVVLEPGNFGGSLEFTEILKKKGLKRLPTLVEFECMIYSGFKENSGSVWVSGFKKGLKMAAYPGNLTGRAFEVLQKIYPHLEATENIIETGLSNINTVVHAPIFALNAGWAQQPDTEFLFYWEGCTEAVGRVVEGIEAERMALGEALGVKLRPSRETLIIWYGHQGASGETLTEVLATNPAYEWDYTPKDMKHRFFLEDIPYGMIPMESIGTILQIPTPLTTAIIEIGSSLSDEKIRESARDLRKFGLQNVSKDELLEKMKTGGEDRELFPK